MVTVDRAALGGTPDEVRREMEILTPGLAPGEVSAGERFRILAAELTQRDDVTVQVTTYEDQSQEPRITWAGFPDSGQITIDHSSATAAKITRK